jgi:hypothetical protein
MTAKHRIPTEIEMFAYFVHRYFYERVAAKKDMGKEFNYSLVYSNNEFIYTDSVNRKIYIGSVQIIKIHNEYYKMILNCEDCKNELETFLFTDNFIVPFCRIKKSIKEEE